VTPDPYLIAELDAPPAVEAVEVDASQAQLMLAFGASDIASLFVGYGLRDPALLGDKARKNGKRKARGRWQLPRIVLEKAGVVRPLAVGAAADAGKARERLLVQQWRMMVERGTAGPDAQYVDASSIRYVPDEPFPLVYVDPEEFRLRVSPDVMAKDTLFGERGCYDTKCSMHGYELKRGGLPLEHVIQVTAQCAAMGGTHGGIVEGLGWSAEWKDRDGEPSGPIVTWGIARDEALVTEIRQVVRHAWAEVEMVRAEAMEAA
jgi:hypothetical protein